jgi:hypothetical protein
MENRQHTADLIPIWQSNLGLLLCISAPGFFSGIKMNQCFLHFGFLRVKKTLPDMISD